MSARHSKTHLSTSLCNDDYLNHNARIEIVEISAVRPLPKNPRTHRQKQIRKIAESIQKFRFINPLIVDEDGNIIVPKAVAKIYEAVAELKLAYPGRPFTPDGHLIGSIGEVIARETFGFELSPPSKKSHDATCAVRSDVQVKITAGKAVAMRGACNHLIVLKLVSPSEAEIVFDGPGTGIWEDAGKTQSNGQRRVSLAKLKRLAART
jgi:hypothetical protein